MNESAEKAQRSTHREPEVSEPMFCLNENELRMIQCSKSRQTREIRSDLVPYATVKRCWNRPNETSIMAYRCISKTWAKSEKCQSWNRFKMFVSILRKWRRRESGRIPSSIHCTCWCAIITWSWKISKSLASRWMRRRKFTVGKWTLCMCPWASPPAACSTLVSLRLAISGDHCEIEFSERHAERSLQTGSEVRLRHDQGPKRKQRRIRRMKSNIATNKWQINGPLETVPLVDPFFAKIQTISHDLFSAKRLFLNIIETKESSLTFPSNERFWCSRRNVPNNYNEDNEYEWPDHRIVSLPVELDVESHHSIRQQLQGFRIEKESLDSDSEEWVEPIQPILQTLLLKQTIS